MKRSGRGWRAANPAMHDRHGQKTKRPVEPGEKYSVNESLARSSNARRVADPTLGDWADGVISCWKIRWLPESASNAESSF